MIIRIPGLVLYSVPFAVLRSRFQSCLQHQHSVQEPTRLRSKYLLDSSASTDVAITVGATAVEMLGSSCLLAGTLPTNVADTAALVAGLRPRVGAVLHNVPNLQIQR